MPLTKNPIFDVIGTGRTGLLLVTVAVFLAIEVKALLLGESATPGHISRIVAAIESVDGIDRVVHQRTLHVGLEEVLVGAKVAVLAGAGAAEIPDTINSAVARAREAAPDLTLLMYVEPDLDTGETERPSWQHSEELLERAGREPMPPTGGAAPPESPARA